MVKARNLRTLMLGSTFEEGSSTLASTFAWSRSKFKCFSRLYRRWPYLALAYALLASLVELFLAVNLLSQFCTHLGDNWSWHLIYGQKLLHLIINTHHRLKHDDSVDQITGHSVLIDELAEGAEPAHKHRLVNVLGSLCHLGHGCTRLFKKLWNASIFH